MDLQPHVPQSPQVWLYVGNLGQVACVALELWKPLIV